MAHPRRKKQKRSRKTKTKSIPRIYSFDFSPGRVVARKYEIVSRLGEGWEAEVYKIRERRTGITRAAKFFFPQRNVNRKTSNFYARKLHKLRNCPVLVQYHAEEEINVRGIPVTVLISEYERGEVLREFLRRQPGGRLSAFAALHLLYSLASGVEKIHRLNEYHGDLHSENVIVSKFGLTFELKILDLFHWAMPKKQNIQDDVRDLIKIFYLALGGAKHYAKQPAVVKDICCGLNRAKIARRFKTAQHLREYLESIRW